MNRRPQLSADDLRRIAESIREDHSEDDDKARLLAELYATRLSLRRAQAENVAILAELETEREFVRELSSVFDSALSRHEYSRSGNKRASEVVCLSCSGNRMPEDDIVHETGEVFITKLRNGDTPLTAIEQR